ncbi:LPS translocon maturation chaperone LptM [Roseateles sp.]
MKSKILASVGLALMALAALTACGQKGPLVLPEASTAASAPKR